MFTSERNIKTFTSKEVAAVCDHTFLKRTEQYKNEGGLGESPVKQREKDFYRFLETTINAALKPYAVCIRSEDVPHAFRFLEQHPGKKLPIVATVGFPDGSWYKLSYKVFEAQYAMGEGADEVDFVMNYQALKEGNYSQVLQEVQQVSKVVHIQGGKMKLILETAELSNAQIMQACRIAAHTGCEFVKTSTGFAGCGVTQPHLEAIYNNFQGGIKISGGITFENISTYLSMMNNITRGTLKLDPDKFRIGESQLLQHLHTQ